MKKATINHTLGTVTCEISLSTLARLAEAQERHFDTDYYDKVCIDEVGDKSPTYFSLETGGYPAARKLSPKDRGFAEQLGSI